MTEYNHAMLIAYDNLFVLEPEPLGEKTRFAACAHSRVMLCLSTHDFRVEHKDGKAEVSLSRHLTHEQARELAKSILRRVDELEVQEKVWQTSYSGNGGVITSTVITPDE